MIDDQLVTMIFAGHDTTAFARLETTLALATIGQRYALEPEMTMAARDGAPARVFTR
jgi:cytochrome P450